MLDNVDFRNETDKFIDLFKELEYLIKKECNKVGIETKEEESLNYLINKLSKKNKLINSHKEDLDFIRRVRNINWHEKDKEYRYVACPSPTTTNKLQNIVNEIKRPPFISDSKMMIKRKDIFYKMIDSSIYETIKIMSEKLYTHVPIFEGNNLVGVFSENTLLDIVRLNTGIILDEKTDFSTIREALKIENHSMESFIFISKKKNIYDVEDLFKNYFSRHKRIGCIFVTDNGKKGENILGMLTAWDVLGK